MKKTLHNSFLKKLLSAANLRGAFLCLLIFSVSGLLQAQDYEWRNVKMGGGGFVSALIPSQNEEDLLYARTDVGGAYRWDAANEEWIPLLDWVGEDQVGYLGVESLAIDPVEPNKLYMLVGISYFNGGRTAILRSDDYGQSFSVSELTSQFKAHGNGMGRQTGEMLVVDANKPNILFTGTRWNGLFKSLDSGENWSRVNSLEVTTTPNENGISFVLLDSLSSPFGTPTKTIFVGVSRNGTNLYRSDDGGETFSPVSGGPTELMPHRAVLAGDGNLYITYANGAGPHPHWAVPEPMDAGKVMKYDTESGTWTDVTPSGISAAFGGISVDPENPERIITSTINQWLSQDGAHGDHFFLSTNGGSTWTNVVQRGFELNDNGYDWINGQSIHWAGSIEFDPFNPQKVWVTSGNGIYSTEDVDASPAVWDFTVRGLEETVPLNLVSIPNGPVVSIIMDYDGFVHEDVNQPGRILRPAMGSNTGLAYAALNPKVMLRYGDKMYYSTDMGASWTQTSHKGNKGQVAISANGDVFLHAPEAYDTTYYSIDKGANWRVVKGLGIKAARPVADPVNPAKFYAYNPSSGALLVSTDAGISFTEAGNAGIGGSNIIRTVYGREGHLWVALNGGGLTRSTNSGTTFSRIPNVQSASAVGIGKKAPGGEYPTVFIWGTVDNQVGLYRSTDEGASWTRINDDAHEFGGPGNGQFVVGDMNVFGRVYMSTAGRGIVYGETSETCIPDVVEPQIKMGEGEMEMENYVVVGKGENLLLSPFAAEGGAWTWTGPNGFSSENREVILENIQEEKAGLYTVRFTNSAGCQSAVQTFLIGVSERVTGVEKGLPKGSFKAYPNPSDGIVTVLIPGPGFTELQIVDLNGKIIRCEKVEASGSTYCLNAQLPQGVYLLRLNGRETNSSFRMLIQ